MKEGKQVIVVRPGANMPPGKMAAQVAHAAVGALLSQANRTVKGDWAEYVMTAYADGVVDRWLNESFVKVVLDPVTDDEYYRLLEIADKSGLMFAAIIDEGRTCFNFEPTDTCFALGPADPDHINEITGHLRPHGRP